MAFDKIKNLGENFFEELTKITTSQNISLEKRTLDLKYALEKSESEIIAGLKKIIAPEEKDLNKERNDIRKMILQKKDKQYIKQFNEKFTTIKKALKQQQYDEYSAQVTDRNLKLTKEEYNMQIALQNKGYVGNIIVTFDSIINGFKKPFTTPRFTAKESKMRSRHVLELQFLKLYKKKKKSKNPIFQHNSVVKKHSYQKNLMSITQTIALVVAILSVLGEFGIGLLVGIVGVLFAFGNLIYNANKKSEYQKFIKNQRKLFRGLSKEKQVGKVISNKQSLLRQSLITNFYPPKKTKHIPEKYIPKQKRTKQFTH